MDSKDHIRPTGREEIRAAVLKAANELFASLPPEAVTVKEIAKRARVNHGLIHRHFGGKDALLSEVLKDHAKAFRTSIDPGLSAVQTASQMFDVIQERPAFFRILIHLLINDYSISDIWQSGAGLERRTMLTLREKGYEENRHGDEDVRLRVALSSLVMLAWPVLEDFLIYAVGYSGGDEKARNFVRSILPTLLEQSDD